VKYSDQRKMVEGLRELADFIENNIELPIEYPEIKVTFWVHEREQHSVKESMAMAARAMGNAAKIYTGSYFDLRKKFGESVTLEFTSTREGVCRRVVKEVIHHEQELVQAYIKPARDEEVVEWVCDEPLLRS
jgi:hypothetical protein